MPLLKLFTIIVFLLLSACAKNVPVYKAVYSNSSDIAALCTVLLVGPDFDYYSHEVSPAWVTNTRQEWQKLILEEFENKKGKTTNYVLTAPEDIDRQMAKIRKELGIDNIPKFDTKRGERNKVYEEAVVRALCRLADIYKTDGIAHLDFAVITHEIINRSVSWDGRVDSSVYDLRGKVQALSLAAKLYRKNGALLLEGRSGYRLLFERGGFLSNNKILSLQDAFDKTYDNAYIKYSARPMCIKDIVAVLSNPMEMWRK